MLIPFDHLFQEHQIRAEGVLHLGANTGQELVTYHKCGVKRVIWVEAIPELHQQLARNIAGYPEDIALLACVGDVDGKKVKFNIASNGGQSSSILELGTHKTAHPTVKYTRAIELEMERVDTLFRRCNLQIGKGWFLNIDLQGAELIALKGMGALLSHFDFAYIEVNVKELYVGCPQMNEIDEFLAKDGFTPRETMMTGWGWGDRFYRRIKSC